MSRKKKRILIALMLIGAAAFFAIFLAYRNGGNEIGYLKNMLMNRPKIFLFDTIFFLLWLVILVASTKRPFLAIGITWVLIIGVSYASNEKFIARGMPLLPEDLVMASETASLMQFINAWDLSKNILAMILVLSLVFVLEKSIGNLKEIVSSDRLKTKNKIIARVASVVLAVIGINLMIDMTRIPLFGIDWVKAIDIWIYDWNQSSTYRENSFVVGFMYNMRTAEIKKPENYKENTIETIAKKYQKNTVLIDESKEEPENINIVMVLNESFYDPKILTGIYDYSGPELTPNLDKIRQGFPSGFMSSSSYGGGTANVEFEVLTGLTNFWAKATPYQDIVPKIGQMPSFASFLKEAGFETKAIHAFSGGMYKRNISLKNLGFDEFIDESGMKFKDREGEGMINDRSIYREATDILKANDGNKFLHIITMQNHMPYHDNIYKNISFSLKKGTDNDEEKRKIEIYLQLLNNSDRYLGEWLKELSQLKQKTVVLFYGDHSPGVFPLAISNERAEIRDLAHLTPYFIWSNFEIKNAKKMKKLPTTSPNCLGNTLFNILGVKKPKIGYLLDDVCADVPILTRAHLAEAEEKRTEAIREYELVNYDLMRGKKWWKEYAD